MPWKASLTRTFGRDFKKLASVTQERVMAAIEELMVSEDPRRLGHALHGRWSGHYSYSIGLQYRLIYRVNFSERTIEFVAVGTHKVY